MIRWGFIVTSLETKSCPSTRNNYVLITTRTAVSIGQCIYNANVSRPGLIHHARCTT